MLVTSVRATFDPLRSRNAHLNFRLGVTADRYLRDFYGETTSPLHRGIGTDRLWVSWDLGSGRGAQGSEVERIEIPRDLASLSIEEARDWRDRTRRQFEEAFGMVLIAVGFDNVAYVLAKRG